MKVLVTGASGQLGHDVVRAIGSEVIGTSSAELDITDKNSVFSFVESCRPDTIVHCAAYTAVEKAEKEPEKCHAVNTLGTAYMAEAAARIDAKFLYISTDYVFDGNLGRPYEVDDIPSPLGVYGRTKYEGEVAVRELLRKHFVVRTSWVYGVNGGNFVKTMLRLGKEHGSVRVVNDQSGAPTYTKDLAKLLVRIIQSEKYGIYHAANSGFCTWYEYAQTIFSLAGIDVTVEPVSTAELPGKAQRPPNSVFSYKSLITAGFALLPAWQDALERFIAELGECC